MKIVAQRDKTGMAAPALSVIGCGCFNFNFLEVRHSLVNDVNIDLWLGGDVGDFVGCAFMRTWLKGRMHDVMLVS
ncbi:hypothetical protein K5Y32_00375 [Pantoea sp. DY-15]|uniref:hypothetical protein n=1 Tax=unclassified Pantoea TaxID=2630326 RepID=UPI001C97B8FC|nr:MULTISPECIES: hypothetical protein [unclassified Pantoea]MBY4838088.1 hypothetical protein [Pantoea sp. DY-5]MBY4886383.1 hypothetical protein [Pantoea sp. DY-15]